MTSVTPLIETMGDLSRVMHALWFRFPWPYPRLQTFVVRFASGMGFGDRMRLQRPKCSTLLISSDPTPNHAKSSHTRKLEPTHPQGLGSIATSARRCAEANGESRLGSCRFIDRLEARGERVAYLGRPEPIGDDTRRRS